MLRSIDHNEVKATIRFLKIYAEDEKKKECLKAFAECQKIVNWIKKIAKGMYLILSIPPILYAIDSRYNQSSEFCHCCSCYFCWWRRRYDNRQTFVSSNYRKWFWSSYLQSSSICKFSGISRTLQISLGDIRPCT